MRNACYFLIICLLTPISTLAGFYEVGISGSYRKTYQNKDNYSTYKSATGSIAYYFWDYSALELSYTRARTDEIRTDYRSRGFVEFYGLDLIITFADRKADFQPYIKVGANYQNKEAQYKQLNQDVVPLPKVDGWAPSAGAGLKFLIGKNLALKAGVDVWSSPLDEDDVTYDYAGRLGISIVF
jgi:outer membrane protein W